jgi:hypothetical protein
MKAQVMMPRHEPKGRDTPFNLFLSKCCQLNIVILQEETGYAIHALLNLVHKYFRITFFCTDISIFLRTAFYF